jgi:hypothetical protein
MAYQRNRSSVQQDQQQESTENHHGKSLSSGTNYFHDFSYYHLPTVQQEHIGEIPQLYLER